MPDTVTVGPSEPPNFTGRWRSSSADNLSEYLLRQGVPAANIERALEANAALILDIVHSYNRFTVTTGSYTIHYIIVNAAPPPNDTADSSAADNDESLAAALLSNAMEWNGSRLSVISSGDGRRSDRQLIDDRLIITQSIDEITALVTYERITDE